MAVLVIKVQRDICAFVRVPTNPFSLVTHMSLVPKTLALPYPDAPVMSQFLSRAKFQGSGLPFPMVGAYTLPCGGHWLPQETQAGIQSPLLPPAQTYLQSPRHL